MNSLKIISKCLLYAIAAFSVYFILAFFVVAFSHICFPFAFERMEGCMYTHVHRILTGQLLYVRPSIEFISSMYTPLYFYLTAALAKLTGFGFAPLRLTSFLASLGSCILIGCFVIKETNNRIAGLVASGLFIATYKIGGPYLDLARVDPAFLFFFLAAAYWVKFPVSGFSFACSGALMAIACLIKQTGIFLIAPVLVYCILFCSPKRVFYFVVPLIIILGVSLSCMHYLHDGWFFFYIFELPRHHIFLWENFYQFWINEIALSLPFACIVSSIYFLTNKLRKHDRNSIFYMLLLAGMIGVSCMGRSKWGGFKNAIIPAYAGLSLVTGLGVHKILTWCKNMPCLKRSMLESAFFIFCLFQLYILYYNPMQLLPNDQYRQVCQNFVNHITQIKGEVFVPSWGYLSVMAGKRNTAQMGLIKDFYRGHTGPVGIRFINEIRTAVKQRHFKAIFLDRKISVLQDDIEKNYRQISGFGQNAPFWPLVKYIYIPKDNRTNMETEEEGD